MPDVMSEGGNRKDGELDAAYRNHERRWKNNRYVYPVVSRRSRGVSIGININPGCECTFNCVYCQVDRRTATGHQPVDPDRLSIELDGILQDETNGLLYEMPPFDMLPKSGRGVRDIAFSGNGEPTASPFLVEAVDIVTRARLRFGLSDTKIVLITNASNADTPSVQEALALLDKNDGEIWMKLDAGTDEYFRKINRASIPLGKILANILKTARRRPLVIQSLWLRLDGELPSKNEIGAYCDRLIDLLAAGAELKRLQLYTIARTPLEESVRALADEELDRIADIVRLRVPVPIEVFYGVSYKTFSL